MHFHPSPSHRRQRPDFATVVLLGLILIPGGQFAEANEAAPRPAFSIQKAARASWLVGPDGRRFCSLGVCCVDQGTAREKHDPSKPGYAAWRYYGSSNAWAEATLQRLAIWGFTTVGGWSEYAALKECHNAAVAFTPVLHMGSRRESPHPRPRATCRTRQPVGRAPIR